MVVRAPRSERTPDERPDVEALCEQLASSRDLFTSQGPGEEDAERLLTRARLSRVDVLLAKAEAELRALHHELRLAHRSLEIERQRYRDVFAMTPEQIGRASCRERE